MCGRYAFSEEESSELRRILAEIKKENPGAPVKTGEIFPTDPAPVLLLGQGAVRPSLCRWGFPHFRGKGVIINARAETATQKNLFRGCVEQRRCAVPVSGFYEWDAQKRKHLFCLPGVQSFYLAGCYQQQGQERRFVILTAQANDSVAPIHDRMPLVMDRASAHRWICDREAAVSFLSAPLPRLEHRGV